VVASSDDEVSSAAAPANSVDAGLVEALVRRSSTTTLPQTSRSSVPLHERASVLPTSAHDWNHVLLLLPLLVVVVDVRPAPALI